MGKEIENDQDPRSGKLWIPYINNRREDWSFMCENNRIVAKEDQIVFKYENFLISPGKDTLNMNGL